MKFVLRNIVKLLVIICSLLKFEGVQCDEEVEEVPTNVTNVIYDVDDYPYLVHIAHNKIGLWCSGTIISSQWILTSATCLTRTNPKTFENNIETPQSYTVIPASTLKNDVTKFISPQKIIVHERFNFITYENDIALIMLPNELSLDDVNIMKLANETDYLNSLQKQGKLVNFKRDYKPEQERISKAYLRKILLISINENNVTVIDPEACRKKITAVIEDGDVCSLYNPNDTNACTGDLGGPLIVNDVQIGIISFGINCNPPSEAVVYTRVDKHLNWVMNQLTPMEPDFRTSSGNMDRCSLTLLFCTFVLYYCIM